MNVLYKSHYCYASSNACRLDNMSHAPAQEHLQSMSLQAQPHARLSGRQMHRLWLSRSQASRPPALWRCQLFPCHHKVLQPDVSADTAHLCLPQQFGMTTDFINICLRSSKLSCTSDMTAMTVSTVLFMTMHAASACMELPHNSATTDLPHRDVLLHRLHIPHSV